jgi:curved DNA-binding protein CbpA
MNSPYDVLGVRRNASTKDIKAAYRRQSRTAHPDSPTGSDESWLKLQDAYELLIDKERRAEYDKTGKTEKSSATAEKVAEFIKGEMRALIHDHVKKFGKRVFDNDLVWQDIKTKVIHDIGDSIAALTVELDEVRQDRQRATWLKERFITTDEFDPVGELCTEEINTADSKARRIEQSIELAKAAVKVLSSYKYKVGPAAEGQNTADPTNHPRRADAFAKRLGQALSSPGRLAYQNSEQ